MDQRTLANSMDVAEQWILALEFGGQSIKAARVSARGEMAGRCSFALDQQSPPTYDAAVEDLLALITKARDGVDVAAIGVGAPSPYDPETLTFELYQKPAYAHLNGRSFKAVIIDSAECERICVENDAVVAARGEMWKGHLAARGKYLFLTLGTGLGACYVCDGRIVQGAEHGATASGELWDYPYLGEHLEENVGTTKAMVKAYVEAQGHNERVIRGDIACLAERAREGDGAAVEAFKRFGRLLADGLSEPIRRFGPRAVVLSGNLSQAFDLFGPEANRLAWDSTPFLKSNLIGRGGLLGAAAVAMDEFFRD